LIAFTTSFGAGQNAPSQAPKGGHSIIQETIDQAPITKRGIIGIGIGVPGIVNYDRGYVLYAPNLLWSDIKLKEIVEEKFNIPTLIDNEANAGAIGEKWFGSGKKESEINILKT